MADEKDLEARAGSFAGGRLADRATDELIGICRGVIADGAVNASEARFVLNWLDANPAAALRWPGDVLCDRLRHMLADDGLDADEIAELLGLLYDATGGDVPELASFSSFSTALPLCEPAPTLVFEGRTFCMTGTFTFGTRKDCHAAVETRGGRVQSAPSGKTHFLVIGDIGTEAWIHSTHGRKIEAAVELKRSGKPIAIVSESHWKASLR